MINTGTFKYSRVILVFVTVLLVFLTIVISAILSQHKEMMEEIHHDAQRELELIGSFTQGALLRQDYASVETFLTQWAHDHKEILSLKAVAPNGFELVNVTRDSLSEATFNLRQKVSYEGRELIDLEMTKDMSPVQEGMVKLSVPLVLGSILLVVIIGAVLWFAMKKLALVPMEKELAVREQAEKKFRILLESAPDSLVLVNKDGTIYMVNGQTEVLFGYRREELEGQEVQLLMPERFRERHKKFTEQFSESPKSRPMGHNLELFGLTKDGREFPADISLSPVETEEGSFILSAVRDISERKNAEEKIRRSFHFQTAISSILNISLEPVKLEIQLQRILDAILAIPSLSLESMGCIYLVEENPDLLVMKANRGLPDSIKSGCATVPFKECLCGEAASEGKVLFAECTDRRHKTEVHTSQEKPHSHYCVPIISGDKTLGVINLVVKEGHKKSEDEETLLKSIANTLAVTIEHNHSDLERQKLQEQLSQVDKMSALGRLTANVAHEIRNPLTLIGGFARKLNKDIAEGTKDKEFATIIIDEVSRLEKILTNVLTYSRETPVHRERHNIKDVVEESLKPFKDKFEKKSIVIAAELNGTPEVMMDRDQVREVFNNILSNALDSMADGGILTISCAPELIKSRKYMAVHFRDTGEGISEDNIKVIFEPFYTTKIIGQGTGLGLPISKKIMEDHGGLIAVDSLVGKGTTFSLYFPLNDE